MTTDPNTTSPQSFDDMELQLQAEAITSQDILPPDDAAQDGARSEEKKDTPPKPEKKPDSTEPKDTDPKAKEKPAPKDAKAPKEAERQDRSWKKLAEEREKDRLQRDEIAKEREAIARDRAEIERTRAEARQQPPPAPKDKDPELNVESLTALATNKRTEATRLRNNGRFAEAEKAEALAEEADSYAKTLPPTGPNAPERPAPGADPKPGSPEFLAAQRQVADHLSKDHPDLTNPESPLSKATALALRAMPHLQRTPDGVAGAVAVAELIVDRNTARASEAAMKQQVATLTQQLQEAQARVAGAPPGGGAANPPKPTDLAALPTAEAWERLRSTI